MYSKYFAYVLFCLFAISVMSCNTKEVIDVEAEGLSTKPVIELLDIFPAEISLSQQDSLHFIVAYYDGDGDLGYENKDSSSLFIRDMRPQGETTSFYVPLLNPSNTSVSIRGEVHIVLKDIAKLSEETEQTYFQIQLKDRSGNWSNIVQSANINIQP
ncbi:MAG: hypothetical protein R2798_12110 [Chitinophagales bacterium]|nr:hypothetical protein [Bacteroidota bacterium]MCB9043649.1 hypothetical protein [Chitinophagales bacterium]